MSANAVYLEPQSAQDPVDAFLASKEFARLHRDGRGCLHLTLPQFVASIAIIAGWAI